MSSLFSVDRKRATVQVDWEAMAPLIAKPWPNDLVTLDLEWQDATGLHLPGLANAARWGWSASRVYRWLHRRRTCA